MRIVTMAQSKAFGRGLDLLFGCTAGDGRHYWGYVETAKHYREISGVYEANGRKRGRLSGYCRANAKDYKALSRESMAWAARLLARATY